jgi:SAM-dependent methyltransferase
VTAKAPEALDDHDDLVHRLPRSGRALDVACGAGAQTLWLAHRGLTVVALDVSPVAIGLTEAAAIAAGLGEVIDARVCDLDCGLPADLGHFDVVVCQRFRGRSLYEQIFAALTPGGIAIVTVLSSVGVAGEPGEFHAPGGELVGAFDRPDADTLVSREADGIASIVVRRRPAPLATKT